MEYSEEEAVIRTVYHVTDAYGYWRLFTLHFALMTSKPNPLPFNETLRDLALLRSSDVDFSSLLSSIDTSPSTSPNADLVDDAQESVQRSYEFVREARAALKVLNRSEVDREGIRVDDVRGKLEDVLEGLKGELEQ
ncbi:hypothetical protein EUX98_g8238 [Antrodiella citrinella]|uniref:Uncharacterized protein n=1 Tax=Antrodiella citrinella TaxID=2447956 RepID=A0A4S4M9S2_9APHY|nr:hypothetical protein EUX98_g8238 [Antrodiella citrinella]